MIYRSRIRIYAVALVFAVVVQSSFGFPRFGFGARHRNELHRAAIRGDSYKLDRTLRENPAAAKTTDAKGNTALHMAALHGRAEAVHLLLRAGVSTDSTNAEGMTPLMMAAEGGQIDVAKMLLKAGANPFLKDTRGWTAAKWARKTHHYQSAVIITLNAAAH
ncbi:MAG: ankyrin repeat domain-containing protein [Verrucomicrobiota bacterium]|nr:ankyrin repeat domain-containing protein [Verrucomicrobiota bacterium]